MISKRVKDIAPSATLAIDAQAKQMIREGKDVVAFGAGQPDFPTPDNIKQAAIRAINANYTGYTESSGSLELRTAICKKLLRDNRLSYEPAAVIVSMEESTFSTIFSKRSSTLEMKSFSQARIG